MRAARLAIFLESADVIPIVRGSTYREYFDSLHDQYRGLTPEVRQRARIEGRRRIREQGLESTAIRLIPVPLPICGVPKLSPKQRRQIRAKYRQRVRRWFPETPPCPKCLIGPGMPKRSWPSRKLAEWACRQQKDPGLHVYPCPAQSGFWHLGHDRRRPYNLPLKTRTNSAQSTTTPDLCGTSGARE